MTINLETFQNQLEQYISAHNLTKDGDSFSTHSSLLCPVTRDGSPYMVKIVDTEGDEMIGASMLRLYDGHGAIRIFDQVGSLQLLERIKPQDSADSLVNMVCTGRDPEATEIICKIIQKLHPQVQGKMIDGAITFEKRVANVRKYFDSGSAKSDQNLFEYGVVLSEALVQESRDSLMLVHGDLHHYNVLSSNRGWLAIDPKGIVAHKAYEYAPSLCDPAPHVDIVANKETMNRRARIMSEYSGIDVQLIVSYGLAHALQVAAWCQSDEWRTYWIRVAQTARDNLQYSIQGKCCTPSISWSPNT